MRSFLATLRSLVLPYGTTSGQRIVLNGTAGNIQIYNAAGQLIVLIDPVGFIEVYDGPTGNQIATMDDLGLTAFQAGLRAARLNDQGLLIFDGAGLTVGQLDDATGLQLTGLDVQIDGKSLPRGVLDVQTNTTGLGPTTAGNELTLATGAAIACDGVQRVRLVLDVPLFNGSVAGDHFDFRIKEGATTLKTRRKRIEVITTNSEGCTVTYTTPTAPAAGNHTYSATVIRVTGTGTLTIPTSATAPLQFTSELVGSG